MGTKTTRFGAWKVELTVQAQFKLRYITQGRERDGKASHPVRFGCAWQCGLHRGGCGHIGGALSGHNSRDMGFSVQYLRRVAVVVVLVLVLREEASSSLSARLRLATALLLLVNATEIGLAPPSGS